MSTSDSPEAAADTPGAAADTPGVIADKDRSQTAKDAKWGRWTTVGAAVTAAATVAATTAVGGGRGARMTLDLDRQIRRSAPRYLRDVWEERNLRASIGRAGFA
jgi:hypothetical protein